MSHYPVEADDEYYEDDFEDEDAGTTSKHTSPRPKVGGGGGGDITNHTTGSFSSYHTSDDDEADGVGALLGHGARRGQPESASELDSDEITTGGITAAAAAARAAPHTQSDVYPTEDRHGAAARPRPSIVVLEKPPLPGGSAAERDGVGSSHGHGAVEESGTPLSTSAHASKHSLHVPAHASVRRPVETSVRRSSASAGREGSNMSGVVYESNITSVQVLLGPEGGSHFLSGSAKAATIEDDEEERDIRTSSVVDDTPLRGRLRAGQSPSKSTSTAAAATAPGIEAPVKARTPSSSSSTTASTTTTTTTSQADTTPRTHAGNSAVEPARSQARTPSTATPSQAGQRRSRGDDAAPAIPTGAGAPSEKRDDDSGSRASHRRVVNPAAGPTWGRTSRTEVTYESAGPHTGATTRSSSASSSSSSSSSSTPPRATVQAADANPQTPRKPPRNSALSSSAVDSWSREEPDHGAVAGGAQRYAVPSSLAQSRHARPLSIEAADVTPAKPVDAEALVDRVEALKREVMAWHSEIEQKERYVERLKRRYYGEDGGEDETHGEVGGGRTGAAGGPGPRRRSSDSRGDAQTRRRQRIDQLRKENEQLEVKRKRFSGSVVDVAFLITRLEEQQYRAQNQLKELQALRRALESRDKRAAHTIEELHRRMPSREQLANRQLNDGLYGQTVLDRRLRELREQIDKTTQSRELFLSKCAELEKEARRRNLSTLSAKECAQLKSTADANAKQIHKLKSAIAIYTAAVNAITLPPSAVVGRGHAHGGRTSTGSSAGTSAVATPMHGHKQGDRPTRAQQMRGVRCRSYLHDDDSEEGNVFVQRETLASRRQLIEDEIAILNDKINQRRAQIEANAAFVERCRRPGGGAGLLSPMSEVSAGADTSGDALKTSAILFGLPTPTSAVSAAVAKRRAQAAKAAPKPTAARKGSTSARSSGATAAPLDANGSDAEADTTEMVRGAGVVRRIVSAPKAGGPATLERLPQSSPAHLSAALRSVTSTGRGDEGKTGGAAESEAVEEVVEDTEEDSVADVLRAIDAESHALGLGVPSRPVGGSALGNMPKARASAGEEKAGTAPAARDEPLASVEDESIEDVVTDEARSADKSGDGAVGDVEDGEESVEAAEEVGASGRSTPVWLR